MSVYGHLDTNYEGRVRSQRRRSSRITSTRRSWLVDLKRVVISWLTMLCHGVLLEGAALRMTTIVMTCATSTQDQAFQYSWRRGSGWRRTTMETNFPFGQV